LAIRASGLNRHSPGELWNGVDDSSRRGSPEAKGGLRSAPGVSVVPGVPNDVRSADLVLFLVLTGLRRRRDRCLDTEQDVTDRLPEELRAELPLRQVDGAKLA